MSYHMCRHTYDWSSSLERTIDDKMSKYLLHLCLLGWKSQWKFETRLMKKYASDAKCLKMQYWLFDHSSNNIRTGKAEFTYVQHSQHYLWASFERLHSSRNLPAVISNSIIVFVYFRLFVNSSSFYDASFLLDSNNIIFGNIYKTASWLKL